MTVISQIFENIEHWKRLPAYRAEPRIDWLVANYMGDILENEYDGNISVLIPEFPIRVGTIWDSHENTNHADRSYKVDFYAKMNSGKNIFVEFKTDSGSRRVKQDAYLVRSTEIGMTKIVAGIKLIAKVSPYKVKYDYLISQLSKAGLLSDVGETNENIDIDDKISVIYMQPLVSDSDAKSRIKVVDFNQIASIIVTGHSKCTTSGRIKVYHPDLCS